MQKTRHEEYVRFDGNLPFFLQIGLRRTSSTCSTEKNWHENLEIQLCVNGEGEVLLDGEKYRFSKGDIAVVNSDVIHYTSTENYLEYSCLIVDTAFCRQVGIDPSALLFSEWIKSRTLVALFEELTAAYLDETLSYRAALLHDVVLRLLIELCKNHSVRRDRIEAKPRSFENVKNAIKFIRQNFAQKTSLDEISQSVYTDKYALAREFKKITGKTIVTYLNNYRCQKAAEYISEGMSVTEAAWRCGFENMSFFSKTFKKYLGKLPSKFKSP